MADTCTACKFYKHFRGVKEFGECTRYPPNNRLDGTASLDTRSYPRVRYDETKCGEFIKYAGEDR